MKAQGAPKRAQGSGAGLRLNLFRAVRPQLEANLFDQFLGIEQVVVQQDDWQICGRGAAQRRGIGDAGHDDVRTKGVHDTTGLVDAPSRRHRKVQAGQDRLAAGRAVGVVIDDEHERREAFLVAVPTAAAARAATIRPSPLVVHVVRASKRDDVTHSVL